MVITGSRSQVPMQPEVVTRTSRRPEAVSSSTMADSTARDPLAIPQVPMWTVAST